MGLRLLSGDAPRSRILSLLLIVVFLGLALAPFLFPGVRALHTAATICVFILLVASYDLLLGYSGIVSFAHTMFFGLGAYGVALASIHMGRGWDALLVGTLAGALAATVLAYVTYQIPRELTPAFRFGEVFGTNLNGRLLNYYLVFFACLALFLLLLRLVNSPFGRVLQSIRENDFRAEAIGYRVVHYRTAATCMSAAIAALAGSLYAIWLRYVGPDTTLSFEIMIDVLLMVVIGGMGTMYGAVIGATIFVLAQNYLQNLMGVAAEATANLPLIPDLIDPNRWLMWLGILFVLSVYFFPSGIVGRLRAGR